MPTPPVYTLSQLLGSLRRCLEQSFNGVYWIKAETSDLRCTSVGHCYLELIEKGPSGNIIARIRGTIWANTLSEVNYQFTKVNLPPLASGMNLLCAVRVSYHEQYGLSLNIQSIDPTFSLGEVARLRQETISKLKEDGLFDINRSLPLPRPLRRIALISSKTAAGYQDFMKHIEDAGCRSMFQIAVFPALMQGEQVTNSIIQALDKIYQFIECFDCVVIIRGGGATSELRAFDDLKLLEYCAQFPLPLIVGIGHDRDISILDMIANTSMKTPTAVADFLTEKLIQEINLLEESIRLIKERRNMIVLENTRYLDSMIHKIPNVAVRQLSEEKSSINLFSQRLQLGIKHRIQLEIRKLTQSLTTISIDPKMKIANEQARLRQNKLILSSAMEKRLIQEENKLDKLSQYLRLSHPENIVKKGFAIVSSTKKIISSATQIENGQSIKLYFHDGIVDAVASNQDSQTGIDTLIDKYKK